MKKIHLCSGTIYLRGYENCDLVGEIVDYAMVNDGIVVNPNETALDKYFKFPFEPDFSKRPKKQFILDTKMDILKRWHWVDNSVDEIIMINAWEHFWHTTDILHIRDEVQRVLKKGGRFIVNFPNIKEIVDKYYESDPVECMNLIYCNHKNYCSIHHFGYTPKTFKEYWKKSYEVIEKTIVPCDHPMTGMIVTKR